MEKGCGGRKAVWPPLDESDTGDEKSDLLPLANKINVDISFNNK